MSEPRQVPLDELHFELERLLDRSKEYLQAHVSHKIPFTIIVGRLDVKEIGDDTVTMYAIPGGPFDKDEAEDLINALAKGGAADVMIVISESWVVTLDERSGQSREEFDKTTEAIYAEYGNLERHPYRREGLILTAHTRTHDIVRHLLMERNAEGLVIEFDDAMNTTSTRQQSDASAGSLAPYSRFRPEQWGRRLTLAEVSMENERMQAEEDDRMRRRKRQAEEDA